MSITPIYLDYNASTPVHPRVIERMRRFLESDFGNPSSIHQRGRQARKALEEARELCARAIGARPKEIVFTSGGTEADNLAIAGTMRACSDRGRHIVTSAIEHSAVLNSCKALEEQGFEVTVVDVGPDGLIPAAAVEAACRPDTVLVSLMLANNETGAIQPVAEVAARVRPRGVLVHTDAVQAFGKTPIDVDELNVDLLSLSSHKIYGPKGAGCLYVREGTPLLSCMWGGAHERGLRAGTECGPALVGFGEAVRLILEDGGATGHLARLRDRLKEELETALPRIRWNGPELEQTVPNTLNATFPGIDGEALLVALDLAGVCVSGGSACASGAVEPSRVLLAMGLSRDLARSSIRCSLGRFTTETEVVEAARRICQTVHKLRQRPGVSTMFLEEAG